MFAQKNSFTSQPYRPTEESGIYKSVEVGETSQARRQDAVKAWVSFLSPHWRGLLIDR